MTLVDVLADFAEWLVEHPDLEFRAAAEQYIVEGGKRG